MQLRTDFTTGCNAQRPVSEVIALVGILASVVVQRHALDLTSGSFIQNFSAEYVHSVRVSNQKSSVDLKINTGTEMVR